MDPEANLDEQVKLAHEIIDEVYYAPRRSGPEDRAAQLAELVLALDEWRRQGGFDPYTAKSPI